MNDKPEAPQLADALDDFAAGDCCAQRTKAAAELRRLHAENETLRTDAARYHYMQSHWSQLKAKFHPKTGDLHSITMVIVSDHSDARGSPKLDSAIDSLMREGEKSCATHLK